MRSNRITILLVLAVIMTSFVSQPYTTSALKNSNLSNKEFENAMNDISEKDPGTYVTSNRVHNEGSYLQVPFTSLLKLDIQNKAYIGVATDQNYSYIAKLKPGIAFIIDIQRPVMLQHLLYKALFTMAESRVDFARLLLNRTGNSIDEIIDSKESKEKTEVEKTAEKIITLLDKDYGIDLSEEDKRIIKEIYLDFYLNGAYITCGTGPGNVPFKELIRQTDTSGQKGHYLWSDEDFAFLKNMSEKNLIIPLVGDFAGTKCISELGKWLKKRKLKVGIFYTSSVEYWIGERKNNFAVWSIWISNLKALPWSENAVIVRATFGSTFFNEHPRYRKGDSWISIASYVRDFLSRCSTKICGKEELIKKYID